MDIWKLFMSDDLLIKQFFVYLSCCEECGYRIKGGRPLIILIDIFFKVCENIEDKPVWFDEKANRLAIYESLIIKHSDQLKPFVLSNVVSSYWIDKNYIDLSRYS